MEFGRLYMHGACLDNLLSMITESCAIPPNVLPVQFAIVTKKHTRSNSNHRAASTATRKKNFCFACGPDNPHGMHLKFSPDDSGKQFVCRFRLGKRYTGPPGHCHGGIIATILDDAMSKPNRLFQASAATSRMTVEYLRPVPLHRLLEVWSHNVSKRGRRLRHTAEIRDQKGTVLARSHGLFIILDPAHVFRRKKA